MRKDQKVYDVLKQMNISYEIVEHPEALTTEEADRYIDGKEGVRTKTLFLCNKKKTAYYLVVMDDAKRLDLKHLAEILNESRVSFCSPERLLNKMGLTPGIVSIFGLLNNKEYDINVFLDKEMLAEKIMTFHPNVNTKTIFITTEDMFKFLSSLGYKYTIVEL